MLLTSQSKVNSQINFEEKSQTAFNGITKYTHKLTQVQKLMYEVQTTLNDYNQRSHE